MKTIDFEGHKVQVHPLDDDRKDMFVLWLKFQGVYLLRQLRPQLTDEEYAMMLGAWTHDCAGGQLDWGTPRCCAAMITPSGAKQLALLLLNGPTSPIFDAASVDRLFADETGWEAYCNAIGVPDAKPAT